MQLKGGGGYIQGQQWQGDTMQAKDRLDKVDLILDKER